MKREKKLRKTNITKTKKNRGGGEGHIISNSSGNIKSLMDNPLDDLKLSDSYWQIWISKTFSDVNNSINNYFNALEERDKRDLCIKILTLKKYLQIVINNNSSYSPKAKEVLFEIFYLPLSLVNIDYHTLQEKSYYGLFGMESKIDENKVKEQHVEEMLNAWLDYKKNQLLNDFMFLLKIKKVCEEKNDYNLWTEVSGFKLKRHTRNFFKHRFFKEPFKWFNDKIAILRDQENREYSNGKWYYKVDAKAVLTDGNVKSIIDDIEKDISFAETGFHSTGNAGGKKNKTRKIRKTKQR